MKEVFISYSSRDYKEADRLIKELSIMDVSAWLAPRDLTVSSNYSGSINQAIQDCGVVIVLISKNSQRSQQVLNEVALATHYKKEIVAYFLDNEPLNQDFEYYLIARHWIDASHDRIAAMTKLATLLRQLRNSRSAKPKSREVLQAEKNETEMMFIFVRAGVAMVTLIIWLALRFMLHTYFGDGLLFFLAVVILAVVEIFILIMILAPIFGGSGKFTIQILKEIINAFKGEK